MKKQSVVSVLLIVILFLNLLPVGAMADDITISDEVLIKTDNDEFQVTVGGQPVTPENPVDGVTVDSEATPVSVAIDASIEEPDSNGLIVISAEKDVSVIVNGDVSAAGIAARATSDNSTNSVSITGDISTDNSSSAVGLHAEGNGQTSMTVGGDIKSHSDSGYSDGVTASAADSGNTILSAGGNVEGERFGVFAVGEDNGSINVSVSGKAVGDKEGIAVVSKGNSNISISAEESSGVSINSQDNAVTNVTVGSISDNSNGIVASADGNSINRIIVEDGVGSETNGVESYSHDSAKTEIIVKGNFGPSEVDYSEISAYAYDTSSTDITIDGICYMPVYARSEDEGTMTVKASSISNNIDAMSYGENCKTTVDVTGDINGMLEAHASIGGLTSASIGGDIVGTGYGVRSITDGGEVQVSIDGAILSGGGIFAASNYGGKIQVDVEKGITGTYDGIYSNNNRAQTDINVNGDLIVEKERTNAIQSYRSAGTTTITIDGNVTNSGGNGIRVNDSGSGSTQITVSGDVTAENGFGVLTSTNNNGETTIAINGDVSAETYGINASTRENGTASVSVDGDVTAENRGIIVSGDGTGDIDVLITGTLSGEKPIYVGSSRITEENLNITVWKIENENQETPDKIVNGANKNYTDESIQYIIKLEQPKVGGSLSTLGTTESHGYQVAREGDTVTLKVTLEEGYELSAAFNGEGEKVQVITTQDADGNYYITVPKGGGVYLSVSLTQKSNDDASVSFSTTENYFDDSYLEFNKSIVQMILEAKENATVTADAGHWLSMMRMVFKALADRPDVTLEIIYYRGAQRMLLTIPAGTPVLQAIGISETVQFDTLAKLLKIEPVVFTTV